MLTLDQRLVVQDLEDLDTPSFCDHEAIFTDAAALIRRMAADLQARDVRQAEVAAWVVRCWGERVLASHAERGGRLLEEACELAQAAGLPRYKAQAILDHVYARAPGDPAQEAGGVAVTLLALCASMGLSAEDCERQEVARVLSHDVAHFRRRHAEKEAAGVMVERQEHRVPSDAIPPPAPVSQAVDLLCAACGHRWTGTISINCSMEAAVASINGQVARGCPSCHAASRNVLFADGGRRADQVDEAVTILQAVRFVVQSRSDRELVRRPSAAAGGKHG